MSWFKRKDGTAIPPVQSEAAARSELLGSGSRSKGSVSPTPPPSYRTTPSKTYVPSRDGDPYASYYPSRADSTTTVGDGASSKYTRNGSISDPYSRGQGNLDRDRAELFSGYNPEKSQGSGRFLNERGRDPEPGEEEEEDVEGIKSQIRTTKQDSVNSTRNALRMAREAEETARGTLGRLGDQSEKLASTERHLDVSKNHQEFADDKTKELKQLNRSIFRPVITFNKDAKRAAQAAKIEKRYQDEQDSRAHGMKEIRDTQDRLGKAQTYGYDGQDDEEGIGGGVRGRFKSMEQQAARQEQRKRYQFEATASDDEMEDELDDNLDEIADVTKRLKALGMTMGQEIDTQNSRIDRIGGKTDTLDNKIYSTTQKLKRIK